MTDDTRKSDSDGLDEAIDASLRRQFGVTPPSIEQLESMLESAEVETQTTLDDTRAPSRKLWLGLALAATIVIAIVLWPWNQANRTPKFQTAQLVQLYEQTVAAGFEPYYVCEDDQRFAETFDRRQGQSLWLADMPDHKRMSGLSYPGGLSRNTTAMLGYVNERPVMVFVDITNVDQPELASVTPDSDLRVHRIERDGLVFYEVSEFDQPQLVEYMVSERS